jgi:hypothetical protein
MATVFNNLRTVGTATVGADLNVTGSTVIAGNATVNGNLTIGGTQTITNIESEHLLVADANVYLNNGYTSTTATPGGIFVNYGAVSSDVFTVATGGFVAGSGTNATVTVDISAATTKIPDGAFIQIVDAANPANNGVYEVLTHLLFVVTVRGVLTSTEEDFTQIQFVTDTTVAGAMQQVNLSIMRAGTDGVWETASGAVTLTGVGLTFSDLSSGSISHGTLTNLGVDDHAQYAAIGGRAVAQTLIGGTTIGQDLTLQPNAVSSGGAVRIIGNGVDSTNIGTGSLIVNNGGLGVQLNTHVGGLVQAGGGLISDTLIPIGESLTIGTTGIVNDILIGRGGMTGFVSISGSVINKGVTSFLSKQRFEWFDDISSTGTITPTAAEFLAGSGAIRFTGVGNFVYQLPDLTSFEDGLQVMYLKTGATGTITLTATTATIEGGSIDLSAQYDRLTLMYSHVGTRWIIM